MSTKHNCSAVPVPAACRARTGAVSWCSCCAACASTRAGAPPGLPLRALGAGLRARRAHAAA